LKKHLVAIKFYLFISDLEKTNWWLDVFPPRLGGKTHIGTTHMVFSLRLDGETFGGR
jgi:hypothetical protein